MTGAAAAAVGLSTTLVGLVLQCFTIGLFTFYLLALPAAASIQALASLYVHRYEVVAGPLTGEPPDQGGVSPPGSAAAPSAAGRER